MVLLWSTCWVFIMGEGSCDLNFVIIYYEAAVLILWLFITSCSGYAAAVHNMRLFITGLLPTCSGYSYGVWADALHIFWSFSLQGVVGGGRNLLFIDRRRGDLSITYFCATFYIRSSCCDSSIGERRGEGCPKQFILLDQALAIHRSEEGDIWPWS